MAEGRHGGLEGLTGSTRDFQDLSAAGGGPRVWPSASPRHRRVLTGSCPQGLGLEDGLVRGVVLGAQCTLGPRHLGLGAPCTFSPATWARGT